MSRSPIEQARANATSARVLLGHPSWDWLRAIVSTRMTALTDHVMNDDMAESERSALIQRYRGMKEVLQTPENTLAGAESVLESAKGTIEPGDIMT